MSELRRLLLDTIGHVADYRETVSARPVFPTAPEGPSLEALGALPDGPTPPAEVIARLRRAAEPLCVSTTGPRYFGFVVGGALDAATVADVLAIGWDQTPFNAVTSPAGTLVENVAGEWLKDVLGLPATASFGFVTGGQGGNNVGLAAARHHVLSQAGWDVERDGPIGAPRVRVVANGERHATIDRALRLLGLGTAVLEPVATDSQGAIVVDDLERALAAGPAAPTIVCLQAGNVNTGAFDDFARAIPAARSHEAWVHVDGAFGLWAAASPSLRHLVRGVGAADSWGVDGHKWLNVPYDCGYAFCAHPDAHLASMAFTAAYLTGHDQSGPRAPSDYVP
ncbi:MAG TPA: pyridoxal-dependent decarboxylase, partial [Acidimicrobiales bacterium]